MLSGTGQEQSVDRSRADFYSLGRLRTMLLVGFGGLLAIMVVAGFTALGTLRDLHASEEEARREFVARNQALSNVTASVYVYGDEMAQALLANRSLQQEQSALESVLKMLSDARVALRDYPGPRDPAEQQLLALMDHQLVEQQRAVQVVLAWKAEERRRRAADLMNQAFLPGRLQLMETSQQIAMLNRDRLNQASAGLFIRFGQLRDRLTLMIVLALAAGLLLSLLSAAYIMRLERQAEKRYEELARNRRELEELSSRLVDAQEDERRSLSRELHDEVGQSLGALLMEVARVKAAIPADNHQAQEQLGHIKSVAENTVQTVRNMALLLRPSMLDDLGLVPALEWQGREVSRRGQLEVEVHSENVSDRLPDDYKICIYRLVQEALNNASRHSAARNARVQVAQDAQKITVEIADDGKGFDSSRERGLGLVGMEERVKRLGGSLVLTSIPGTGTTIRAELPIVSAQRPVETHEENSRPTVGRS